MDSNNFLKISKKILQAKSNFIFKFFGSTGLNLYNFISKVDSNHSDLNFLINEDHELFCELLQLCNYIKNNKLKRAQDFIIKNIEKYNFDFYQTTLLKNSKRHARFLSNKEKIRFSKKKYKFCSDSFNKDISKLAHEIPNELDLFEKNNTSRMGKIKDLEKKKQRYEYLRCKEFSSSISKVIELLSQRDHHGYRRIPLKVAACFSAKINDIIIDEKYQPSIYPFFKFEKFSSLETLSHIKEAENNGFSYFDHYLIMVPSFKNNSENDDFDALVTRKTKCLVLGEKDGLCYFICLW